MAEKEVTPKKKRTTPKQNKDFSFKEINSFYLQHFSDYLVNSQTNRISFFGFFVTINLAVYYVVYYLKIEAKDIMLWQTNIDISSLVLLLITVVNTLLYVIYTREHFYDRKLDRLYQDYMKAESQGGVKKIREDLLSADEYNRGLTWRAIKTLFSLFCAIPLAYLILVNPFLSQHKTPCLYLLVFSICFFLYYFFIYKIFVEINKNL